MSHRERSDRPARYPDERAGDERRGRSADDGRREQGRHYDAHGGDRHAHAYGTQDTYYDPSRRGRYDTQEAGQVRAPSSYAERDPYAGHQSSRDYAGSSGAYGAQGGASQAGYYEGSRSASAPRYNDQRGSHAYDRGEDRYSSYGGGAREGGGSGGGYYGGGSTSTRGAGFSSADRGREQRDYGSGSGYPSGGGDRGASYGVPAGSSSRNNGYGGERGGYGGGGGGYGGGGGGNDYRGRGRGYNDAGGRGSFPRGPGGQGGGQGRGHVDRGSDINGLVYEEPISQEIRSQLIRHGAGGQSSLAIAPATLGEKIYVLANHFQIRLLPELGRKVQRYQISIVAAARDGATTADRPGDSLRQQKSLKVAQSRAVLNAWALDVQGLQPYQYAFDGRHTLLTTVPLRPPSGKHEVMIGRSNFELTYDHVKELDLVGAAQDFLAGRREDSTSREVLQALDIVLRYCISLLPNVAVRGSAAYILANHHNPGMRPEPLGRGAQTVVGFRAAISLSVAHGLSVTVDTSATAYIGRQNLVTFMAAFLGCTNEQLKYDGLAGADNRTIRQLLKAIKNMEVEFTLPESRTHHPTPPARLWVLKGFDRENRDATQYMFDCALEKGQPKVPMNIAEYFGEKYGLRLEYPRLPVVQAGGSSSYVPAEFLTITGTFVKPNPQQTAALIKRAAFAPQERKAHIMQIIAEDSQLPGNRTMEEFGMELQLDPKTKGLKRVPARLLASPKMAVGGDNILMPERDGFYRMNGQLYSAAHLRSWVVLSMVPSREVRGQAPLAGFLDCLIRSMQQAGITVSSEPPPVVYIDDEECRKYPELPDVYNHALSRGMVKYKETPQLVLVLLDGNGNSPYYSSIKALGLTLGYMSQCFSVQKSGVGKNNRGWQSYCKNLVLKINAKLGGINYVIAPDAPDRDQSWGLDQRDARWRPAPLRGEWISVFGVDVNHDSERDPSIAAVVASWDDACAQYISEVRLQRGPRRELVDDMEEAAVSLLQRYKTLNKHYPTVIVVMRDGIGDSQVEEMLQIEVNGIKKACEKLGINARLVVMMLQKHHNTRLFPEDKTNVAGKLFNVRPGTVVEGLGMTTALDFLLVSHSGSIGTMRGVRHILAFDEVGLSADEIQRLCYWLCFLVCRCTRSVSVCAPVFYADLAAIRGRALLIRPDDASSSDASFRRNARQVEPPNLEPAGPGVPNPDALAALAEDFPNPYSLRQVEPALAQRMHFV